MAKEFFFLNDELLGKARIKEEGCGGCGEPCTKTTDLYGNETQSTFVGASPS
jgi:hypothetical protein